MNVAIVQLFAGQRFFKMNQNSISELWHSEEKFVLTKILVRVKQMVARNTTAIEHKKIGERS